MIFLAHYGVKGQKWGVRNYQNKDGTLTELGKTKLREKRAKAKSEAVENTALSVRHKVVKDLPTSDPELVRKGEYWYNQNGEMLSTFSFEEGKKPIRGYNRVIPASNMVAEHETSGKKQVDRTIYDDQGMIAVEAHGGPHGSKKLLEKYPPDGAHIHEHDEAGIRVDYPNGDHERGMTKDERREYADILRRRNGK